MKGKLLVLASAVLVGCSNAPSSGDIEKVLESATGACQNLEVVDIKKTNGYEEDGFYRVEYTYAIEFKDKSKLQDLYKTWLAEYGHIKQQNERHKQQKLIMEKLRDELRNSGSIYGPQPRPEDFGGDGSMFQFQRMSQSQLAAYKEATREWEARRDAVIVPKQKEMDALLQSWAEEDAKLAKPKVFGQEDVAIRRLYAEGCSNAAFDYVRAVFPPLGSRLPFDADGELLDPAPWFEFKTTQMKGAMRMRKTEQGWQKV